MLISSGSYMLRVNARRWAKTRQVPRSRRLFPLVFFFIFDSYHVLMSVPGPVATTCESTSAEYSEEVRSHAVAPVLDSPEAVPHSWLCDGRLLRLHDPRHPGNLKAFEARWKKGEVNTLVWPVTVGIFIAFSLSSHY